MRLDVLQVVAISGYGAEFLRNGGKAPELLTTNSTFQTVNSLEVTRPSVLQASLLAEGTSPLYRRFVSEGVILLRPLIATCGLTADADASAWGFLTDGDRGLELWRPMWRTRMAGHGDPKPHRVSYTAERASRWHLPPVPNVASATSSLRQSVQSAADLLSQAGEVERAFPLLRCLELQEEGSLEIGRHPDLLPSTGETEGRSLAAAAYRAALIASSGAQTSELRSAYEAIWRAAMTGFEAAIPALALAKAA